MINSLTINNYTNQFSVQANLVSIEIISIPAIVTAYFNFTIAIFLMGNNVPYLEFCTVSIYNNGNELWTNSSVINGSTELEVYLSNIGNQTIVANANGIYGNASVLVKMEQFMGWLSPIGCFI